MKTILWILTLFVMMFGALRVGNAMLIYDQALVFVKPSLCPMLHGVMNDGQCGVTADYSHEFLTGGPMLRVKSNGGGYTTVVLQDDQFEGAAVTNSHYEFFKSWM
jgi:hypothetical protein